MNKKGQTQLVTIAGIALAMGLLIELMPLLLDPVSRYVLLGIVLFIIARVVFK